MPGKCVPFKGQMQPQVLGHRAAKVDQIEEIPRSWTWHPALTLWDQVTESWVLVEVCS